MSVRAAFLAGWDARHDVPGDTHGAAIALPHLRDRMADMYVAIFGRSTADPRAEWVHTLDERERELSQRELDLECRIMDFKEKCDKQRTTTAADLRPDQRAKDTDDWNTATWWPADSAALQGGILAVCLRCRDVLTDTTTDDPERTTWRRVGRRGEAVTAWQHRCALWPHREEATEVSLDPGPVSVGLPRHHVETRCLSAQPGGRFICERQRGHDGDCVAFEGQPNEERWGPRIGGEPPAQRIGMIVEDRHGVRHLVTQEGPGHGAGLGVVAVYEDGVCTWRRE